MLSNVLLIHRGYINGGLPLANRRIRGRKYVLRHLIIPIVFTKEPAVSNEEHCEELDVNPSNNVSRMAATVNLGPPVYGSFWAPHPTIFPIY